MAALDSMGSGRVPSGASATFEEMVSSGDLKILTNTELRNVLFEYDEFSGITRDAWRTLRDEYLVSNSHLVGIVISEADFSRERRDIVTPRVFDRERFLSQPDLVGHLSNIMTIQVNQYELVARQLELAQEIEALLLSERDLKR